jgi:acyl CoA:acetate/3-ketoacid CoA transferase beta subunit
MTEIAPGVTLEQVKLATDAEYTVADDLKPMLGC